MMILGTNPTISPLLPQTCYPPVVSRDTFLHTPLSDGETDTEEEKANYFFGASKQTIVNSALYPTTGKGKESSASCGRVQGKILC